MLYAYHNLKSLAHPYSNILHTLHDQKWYKENKNNHVILSLKVVPKLALVYIYYKV